MRRPGQLTTATAGIAAFALGTVVTTPQIAGGLLVVAGAVVAQRRSKPAQAGNP